MCLTVPATAKIAITWAPRKPLLLHRYGGGFLQVVTGSPPPFSSTHYTYLRSKWKGRKEKIAQVIFSFFGLIPFSALWLHLRIFCLHSFISFFLHSSSSVLYHSLQRCLQMTNVLFSPTVFTYLLY